MNVGEQPNIDIASQGESAGNRERFRYDAALANAIEARWQETWDREGAFAAPNPGDPGFECYVNADKRYILDMFPYPSGVGLHVGHPLGYIATDIYARYLRACGVHVLHAMGYDAFGLPAEQFAVEHGVHPRVTTEKNIATMRGQMRRLGLAHDPARSFSTTDPEYYKWTQWIFLQIFNAWYDHDAVNPAGGKGRARPISELWTAFEKWEKVPLDPDLNPESRLWQHLDPDTQARIVDSYRLAYLDEIPVNWCPALGTVLANEEVTADGRSERGNHPVYKRPLRQWMMHITAYADRLLDDLEHLDWPEPIKMMQRNWIGRSQGALIDFLALDPAEDSAVQEGRVADWYDQSQANGFQSAGAFDPNVIRVFTTRPDTLFGATYMVLAPEHPLVDRLTAEAWPEGIAETWKGRFRGREAMSDASPKEMVAAYRRFAESRSDVERQVETRDKTGVFIGTFAINPATAERIPIFIADYVLMGYGTGAIMAVPAHDTRDHEFARQFDLPIVQVVVPPDPAADWHGFTGPGTGVNSENNEISLNGLETAQAKEEITMWLAGKGLGEPSVNYKLRDWLFSRQRYWGEPFPIVYGDDGRPTPLPESALPVTLPELDDFSPEASDDPNAPPRPPLGRAPEWQTVELVDEDGNRRVLRRELNTMPQWAGSCWYYLRYADPRNDQQFVAPGDERYWMLTTREGHKPADVEHARFDPNQHQWGGVDLYVGGAEHAVLHLLYARFWHKVLFDLGHVSTPEPFQRLFNQGYIQAYAYTDERGIYVPAEEVEEQPGGVFTWKGKPVTRTYGKMGKSLKNALTPDDICRDYGCDTLRLYEMYMGPLEASKPWNTRDIIGSHRFLQRVWRNFVNEQTGELRVVDAPAEESVRRRLHRTIDKVNRDMRSLSFNTAIAAMIELNNDLVPLEGLPREVAEPFVRMLAPFVPHFAEELWDRLGHRGANRSVTFVPFPQADPQWLRADEVELVVQILGKVRGNVKVPADADEATAQRLALADDRIAALLAGKTIRKVIHVPGRLINFVAN